MFNQGIRKRQVARARKMSAPTKAHGSAVGRFSLKHRPTAEPWAFFVRRFTFRSRDTLARLAIAAFLRIMCGHRVPREVRAGNVVSEAGSV